MNDNALLLDTCALLWLASGSTRLSSDGRNAIASARTLLFSPISAWEVAQLVRHGELALPLPPLAWMEAMVERYGLTLIPLSLDVLINSAELPPHHKDPADRIIIASAILRDVPVVTSDRRYFDYGVKTLCYCPGYR